MVIVRYVLVLEMLKFERKKKCVIVSVKIICQGSLFTFAMEQWSLEAFEKTDLACSIKVGLKLITANLLLKKKNVITLHYSNIKHIEFRRKFLEGSIHSYCEYRTWS